MAVGGCVACFKAFQCNQLTNWIEYRFNSTSPRAIEAASAKKTEVSLAGDHCLDLVAVKEKNESKISNEAENSKRLTLVREKFSIRKSAYSRKWSTARGTASTRHSSKPSRELRSGMVASVVKALRVDIHTKHSLVILKYMHRIRLLKTS